MTAEKILANFTAKKILLWGFGVEGQSSLKLLCDDELFAKFQIPPPQEILIYDQRKIDAATRAQFTNNNKLNFLQSNRAQFEQACNNSELILKSPGVPTTKEKTIAQIIPKLSSQTQIFLDALSHRCIGVSGTKGKSTCCALTLCLLNEIISGSSKNSVARAKNQVHLVGNFGKPAFTTLRELLISAPDIESANASLNAKIFVYELSSYQLEYVNKSPRVAVLTNLREDHLSFHGGEKAYHAAKIRIFSRQKPDDYLILSSEANEVLHAKRIKPLGRVEVVDAKDGEISVADLPKISPRLIGRHNLLNLRLANAAARKACEIFLSDEEVKVVYAKSSDISSDISRNAFVEKNVEKNVKDFFKRALRSLAPLPHRLERFSLFDGNDDKSKSKKQLARKFQAFNDSISSAPVATLAAFNAFRESKTSLDVLIVGGFDRGVDQRPMLAEIFSKEAPKLILCVGETGELIFNMFGDFGVKTLDASTLAVANCEELVSSKSPLRRKFYTLFQSSPECVGILAKDLRSATALTFAFAHMRLLEDENERFTLLLSPAAASFDAFANFQERGDFFKKICRENFDYFIKN